MNVYEFRVKVASELRCSMRVDMSKFNRIVDALRKIFAKGKELECRGMGPVFTSIVDDLMTDFGTHNEAGSPIIALYFTEILSHGFAGATIFENVGHYINCLCCNRANTIREDEIERLEHTGGCPVGELMRLCVGDE